MKKLFVLLFLSGSLNVFCQDWPLKKMVIAKKESGLHFTALPVFSFVNNKTLSNRGTYQQLQLDPGFVNQVMNQRPEALQLSIPMGNGKSINCELVKFSLGNIKFTENNSNVLENIKIPVTYRGIVTDELNKNTVLLTVNDDYLALMVSMIDKAIQVTQADENDKTMYRLYNSETVQFPSVAFDCGTKASNTSKTANGIDLTGVRENPLGVSDKCINVMVDCSDSMFQWRNSNTQQVSNYVYELFNSVITGYYNDSVSVQITTINIWTISSPFRAPTREAALAQVAGYWQDNFFGNICVGLDYSIMGNLRSGLAGGIGKVKAVSANTCPIYNYNGTDSISACCYNDLDYAGTYTNFPIGPNTSQSQVYLVMHEMGHLLGSAHTQWCGWKLSSNPDMFGAIDNCAPTENGPCAMGPPPPGGAGTIMSYCNGNVGVNYQNGFGPLPGAAIRNFITQSVCILNCTDCFGALNKSTKELYAFQNNITVIKKGNPASEDNRNVPTQKQTSNENTFINNKK